MDAEELERIASRISARTGLNDRPLCDPYAIACAIGLTVRFVRGLPPHSNGAVIVIPSTVHEQARAYFIAHEVGHFLLRGEERCEELERACSRVDMRSRVGRSMRATISARTYPSPSLLV